MKILFIILFTISFGYSQSLLLFSDRHSICVGIDSVILKLKQPECYKINTASVFIVQTDYSSIKHTYEDQVSYYYPISDHDPYSGEESIFLDVISDTGSYYSLYINYEKGYIATSTIPFDNRKMYFYFTIKEWPKY